MTVAFAVIFMAVIVKQLQTGYKPAETMCGPLCVPFQKPKATTSLSLLTNSAPPLDSRMNSHQKKNCFSRY